VTTDSPSSKIPDDDSGPALLPPLGHLDIKSPGPMTSAHLGPFTRAVGYQEALALDREDPLADFRQRFVIDDAELIYLDGNSLGRLPRRAGAIIEAVVGHEWGDRLIRSWNEGWWDLHVDLGDRLAPIVGASPGEVMISDSTSVNLYKLAMAAMRARPGRSRIITDDRNFPSDVYVLRGVAEANDAEVVVVETEGSPGTLESVEAAIDDHTALVSLSHTTFKSGYTYDLTTVTGCAHRAGALTLWDLSHSVGAFPIDLNRANVDLAVGCTYKYLNGGLAHLPFSMSVAICKTSWSTRSRHGGGTPSPSPSISSSDPSRGYAGSTPGPCRSFRWPPLPPGSPTWARRG
jgi:kynureninase